MQAQPPRPPNSTPDQANSEGSFLPDLTCFYKEPEQEPPNDSVSLPAERVVVQQLSPPEPKSESSDGTPQDGAVSAGSIPVPPSAESNFFDRNTGERPEIIEGILREGELAAFGGPFGMGKSPALVDLTVCLVNGLSWCGLQVDQRPVIVVDCETPGADYKRAIKAICSRRGVPVPREGEELFVYLERDAPSEANTKKLLKLLAEDKHKEKLTFLEGLLKRKPNAVVVIDPLEMFFRLDTGKKLAVMTLYHPLRAMLAMFPHSALLITFNLRKIDRKNGRANLLRDPRGWLEEICGSLDLLNRSDVRLGIDAREEDVRVINGIVRGKEMHPLLIRPFVDAQERPAGFEQVAASGGELVVALTDHQRAHWDKLPSAFRFEDVADNMVPRSTLSRLIKRTRSLGVLIKDETGKFCKILSPIVGTQEPPSTKTG